ncbi:hypothetical protein POV27_13660 [Aureisphaera galaxeae]|uniref:hypothetical protein n=1 Tax=Aureisphaera galaxeae TaxID=1538023 RepID=UPI00235041FB|nr:hypothetical protein [Aureisphaera galaxeae]MDC8005103.1 hypothetical protein [Aureisphaera galaxeae]
MKYLCSLFFILCFLNVFSQESFGRTQEYRKKIRKDVTRNLGFCDIDYAIATIGSKDDENVVVCELTQGCETEPYIKIYSDSRYEPPYFYRDIYYTEGDSLKYAIEEELYIDEATKDTIPWNCQYFFENGKLVDYISHGHGPTEMDDWDPELIFRKFAVVIDDN